METATPKTELFIAPIEPESVRKLAIMLGVSGFAKACTTLIWIFDTKFIPLYEHNHPTEPRCMLDSNGISINMIHFTDEKTRASAVSILAMFLSTSPRRLYDQWSEVTQKRISVYTQVDHMDVSTDVKLVIPSRLYDGCSITAPSEYDISMLQDLTPEAIKKLRTNVFHFLHRKVFNRKLSPHLHSNLMEGSPLVPVSIETTRSAQPCLVVNPIAPGAVEMINKISAMSPGVMDSILQAEQVAFSQIKRNVEFVSIPVTPYSGCEVIPNELAKYVTPHLSATIIKDGPLLTEVVRNMGRSFHNLATFIKNHGFILHALHDYRYADLQPVKVTTLEDRDIVVIMSPPPFDNHTIFALQILFSSPTNFKFARDAKLQVDVPMDHRGSGWDIPIPCPAFHFESRMVTPITSTRLDIIANGSERRRDKLTALASGKKLFELVHPITIPRLTEFDGIEPTDTMRPSTISLEFVVTHHAVIEHGIVIRYSPNTPLAKVLETELDDLELDIFWNAYRRFQQIAPLPTGIAPCRATLHPAGFAVVERPIPNHAPITMKQHVAISDALRATPAYFTTWESIYRNGECPIYVGSSAHSPTFKFENGNIIIGVDENNRGMVDELVKTHLKPFLVTWKMDK